MGVIWEAYHKGVPLLGIPGITLEETLMGRWFRVSSSWPSGQFATNLPAASNGGSNLMHSLKNPKFFVSL